MITNDYHLLLSFEFYTLKDYKPAYSRANLGGLYYLQLYLPCKKWMGDGFQMWSNPLFSLLMRAYVDQNWPISRESVLEIERSVKMQWHRLSMGISRSL